MQVISDTVSDFQILNQRNGELNIMTSEQYDAFCDWVNLIDLPEESWYMYFEAYYQALEEMEN